MKEVFKLVTYGFAIFGFVVAGFAAVSFVILFVTDGRGTCADEIDRAYYREQSSQYDKSIELGNMYFEGKGVERDYKQAFKHYLAAYELTDAGDNLSAQYKLAYMYQHGLGVMQNYARSVRYYRYPLTNDYSGVESNVILMAQKGSIEAQNLLGDFYRNKNRKREAIAWYQKAAAQGSVHANSSLGQIFHYGSRDVKKDEARAASYFKLAAERGDEYAQDWLEKRKNFE